MTSRRTILASLFSIPLTAADFWQTKKSSEWTGKELNKILKDSPWSHLTVINMDAQSKRSTGGGAVRGSSGGASRRGDGTSSGGSKGGSGGGGGGGGASMPPINLQIRWATAKPVKLAVARLKFGAEAELRPEMMELVNREEKDYRILIEGIPPNIVRQGVDKFSSSLKRNCAIHCAGKDDLVPSDAQLVQGDRGATAVVTFPKTNPFSLDDKEVEFTMKLGKTTAKRKFKLKDMVFDGKLEL